jgi:hypothetical protein
MIEIDLTDIEPNPFNNITVEIHSNTICRNLDNLVDSLHTIIPEIFVVRLASGNIERYVSSAILDKEYSND